MKRLFLVMALLVITASFLTGCAKEEALAGEAITKIIVVGENEELVKEKAKELITEIESGKDGALVGEAMAKPKFAAKVAGTEIQVFISACECKWVEELLDFDCSMCD